MLKEFLRLQGSRSVPMRQTFVLSPIDLSVLQHFERQENRYDAMLFTQLWRHNSLDQTDARRRQQLAALYARAMCAEEVAHSPEEAFWRVKNLSDRACALDAANPDVYEQLAIAYAITQSPKDEAERLCCRSVELSGFDRRSASFYYAFWNTFQGSPQRGDQAEEALRRYRSCPPANRKFDESIASQQRLAAEMLLR